MRVCYQLVENHFVQELPTILITIQNQKYIVNMPECFQRFNKEHRFKFPKASNMFFTKVDANSVAGLFGFMLSLFQADNVWDTKLFLNPQLYDYFEEIRYQMGFKILAYSFVDWNGRCRRGFRSMDRIQELLKRKDYPTRFHHLESYLNEVVPKSDINDASTLLKNGVFKDQNVEIIPFHTGVKSREITNFICKPNSLPGKVIVEKVNELNIPKKFIGKIIELGSMELPDGRTIFAKDFKEADSPAPNFLIVHISSLQGLRQTLKHAILLQYLDNANNKTESVIHIVEDSSVLKTQQYDYFLRMFPEYTRHIIYGKGYKENEQLPQIFRHYNVVSQLAKYFPQTVSDIKKRYVDDWEIYMKRCLLLKDIFPSYNVSMYKRYYEMVLAPLKRRGYAEVPNQTKPEFSLMINEFQVQKIKQHLTRTQKIWNFQQCDPQVIFLGTGSMVPATYRNVSGIMIRMCKDNSIILDCGQGTYFQLLNHFGVDKVDEVLLSVRVIFITHIHSDHNLGILNMIAKRKKLCEAKGVKDDMFLIVPYNMAPWIYAYNEFIQELGVKCLFIQTILGQKYDLTGTMSKDERCYTTPQTVQDAENYSTPKLAYILANYFQKQQEVLEHFSMYMKEWGLAKFRPVYVVHCPQSFGIVIEHKSGIKISYSGDCRPTLQFIEEAANSTLMIHEATFGDDLLQNAKVNMHSTVEQAIISAMKSNSWRLALTHFSQRYKRAADILVPEQYKKEPIKEKFARDNCIICFDHLQMHLSQCEYMPEISRFAMEMLPADKDESAK